MVEHFVLPFSRDIIRATISLQDQSTNATIDEIATITNGMINQSTSLK